MLLYTLDTVTATLPFRWTTGHIEWILSYKETSLESVGLFVNAAYYYPLRELNP